MKMVLPSHKDVKYIRGKLKIWFEANRNLDAFPNNEYVEFKRAVRRLCNFFNISFPEISFYKNLGGFNCKIVGKCTAEGELKLLLPFHYQNRRLWCSVFFHEFGHYIYYANAEKKAEEFEKRMMQRW